MTNMINMPRSEQSTRPRLANHLPHATGFTLIETMLAMVLGAMVLMGSLGVFLGLRNMESTFATRFERTSELGITHTIITRAMLSLQMEETETNLVTRATDEDLSVDGEVVELEPDPRYRMILETDPTVAPDSTGWTPQRFEIVNATPPVPSGLATQAAGWYVAQDQGDSLDFSAMDGSQGIVRGVFELRPAGQRERIMQQLGLINTNDPILDDLDQLNPPNSFDQSEAKPNWTLWWRPILAYEGEQLLYGYGPFPDSVGTPDEIRARLAGSVPLMRNIERCLWELYKGDEYVSTFAALAMSDLPAYAQFEVILTNSQYASWMFEIDWVLGDDPSTDGSGSDADDELEDDDDNNGQPDANDDDDDAPRRPGSDRDPNSTRYINLSDN